jgi:dimethyl sulfoxide reductase iron-sulfur subunit
MARRSMLIDLTRCIGCDACTVACKQENGTPLDTFFARVVNIEAGSYPDVKRVYLPMLCYHCENPACLQACPNKAIFKRQDGIVLIDQDRCRGTGACVSACPYGNVILTESDKWYLNQGEAYEEEYVKPRLNEGVARKCTYCAHRVDEGLDPACVVACPTNARIFGDLDDPESPISIYVDEQRMATGREPFKLLPQAGTRPAGLYLGTMSAQESATMNTPPRPPHTERRPLRKSIRPHDQREEKQPLAVSARVIRGLAVLVLALVFTLAARAAFGQSEVPIPVQELVKRQLDAYTSSNCAGCHGQTGMGGMGPPVAELRMTSDEFMKLVRDGKGRMPGTPASVLSDEEALKVHEELVNLESDPSMIPIAFKVGQLLTTRNVGMIFLGVTVVAFIFGTRVLLRWLYKAGLREIWPRIGRFGYFKAFGVVLWSLFVDGLLVASLWRRNRMRWFMHGLMLYGFLGLMLADILIQIFNPGRNQMDLMSPLKMLPIVSGVALLLGITYVFWRYRTDEYIDNGLTLGKDFLFVNLLFHTTLSGFLTMVLGRAGVSDWLMTIYIYHLGSVWLLLLTAPFTRFAHAWCVPALVAMTRLTDEITRSRVDIGFEREPSPGRHHKTERIARGVMEQLGADPKDEVTIRYYP